MSNNKLLRSLGNLHVGLSFVPSIVLCSLEVGGRRELLERILENIMKKYRMFFPSLNFITSNIFNTRILR